MQTKPPNDHISPFVSTAAERNIKITERSVLSQATMLLGLVALTLAMLGGAWLIASILLNGFMNNLEKAFVGMIPIALAYIVGWFLCILSVRAFNNLFLPFVVRYYAWFTLTGALVLYVKVMQKLFIQGYQFANYLAYNFILLAVLASLLGLHFIPEEHDLRPFSIPIMLMGMVQLVMMIIRYVFMPVPGNGIFVLGDLTIFIVMQVLAVLMMAHLGIFNPFRRGIEQFFRDNGELFRSKA